MGTRAKIALSFVFWTALAAYSGNMAAAYVSIAGHAIFYMLHVIEVKVNKLLDQQALYVTDADIAR